MGSIKNANDKRFNKIDRDLTCITLIAALNAGLALIVLWKVFS